MQSRKVIFLVLFLILISISVFFYLYIKNQEISDNPEEEYKETINAELRDFERPAPPLKNQEAVINELESFKPPVTNTTTTTPNTSGGTQTTEDPVKPKSKAEIIDELNSFTPPPKTNSNGTSDSLNEFNP